MTTGVGDCQVPKCEKPVIARELCGMHYQRLLKHGDVETVLSKWKKTPVERFWSYVDKTDTCWIWTGTRSHGYGTFGLWDKGRRWQVMAHRHSYELLVAPIPEGMTLDHLCHTAVASQCRLAEACPHRACVRPNHLEVISLRENVQRGGYGIRTHCKRGHEFTEENTYITGMGGRSCRICMRIHDANRRARNKAARSA